MRLVTDELRSAAASLVGETLDGKSVILSAREHGLNYWRQMEWAGFHVEHVMRTARTAMGESHSQAYLPSRPAATLDGVLPGMDVPVEVKLSVRKEVGCAYPKAVLLNDAEAMDAALEAAGGIVLCLFRGTAEMDVTGEFQRWRTELHGGPSKETRKNAAQGRKSRMRKRAVHVDDALLLSLTEESWPALRRSAQGRNSGKGAARPPKYSLPVGKFLGEYPELVEIVE